MNTEDSGFIETSAVQNLSAQEETSCNKLQVRHSVQQKLQQKNVVPVTMNTISTINTEDSGFIETSVVWNLSAQEEASCNELQARHSVQQGLQQKNVVPVTMNTTDTMNTEDSGSIETSVVWNLPAQEEASCNRNNESVMLNEVSSITETPAVWNLPAQEASCVMLEGISGATEAHTVQHLSA